MRAGRAQPAVVHSTVSAWKCPKWAKRMRAQYRAGHIMSMLQVNVCHLEVLRSLVFLLLEVKVDPLYSLKVQLLDVPASIMLITLNSRWMGALPVSFPQVTTAT
jgi:hypothetical protein